MLLRPILLAAALAVASGAVLAQEAPRVANTFSWAQGRLASMQHWSVVADDAAREVLKKTGTDKPFFVAAIDATPFEAGLSEAMVTALVRQGARVVTTPEEGARTLALSTTAATHYSAADTQFFAGASALTAGVAVVRAATNPWTTALGAGVFVDLVRHFFKRDPVIRTEVTVTSSVLDAGEVLARTTDTYYINDADASLYGAGHPIRVEGGR